MRSARYLAAAMSTILLLAAGCSGGNDEPSDADSSTPAEVSGVEENPDSTPTTPPGSPTEVVVAYYGALNAGDVATAKAVWPTIDEAAFTVLTNGIRQRVSASCSLGQEAGTAQCEEIVVRNDFTGPAGILGSYVVEYEVSGDNVIVRAEVLSGPEGIAEYQLAFGEWLADSYPDLHSASYQGEGDFPFRTVADAEAVIAVVDEFLAQSDVYPLEQ